MEKSFQKYAQLTELIKHTDSQILQNNQQHFVGITLIIAFATSIKIFGQDIEIWLLFFIMLLAILLVIHWIANDTKYHLQKLCWTKMAQWQEKEFFDNRQDMPFNKQSQFFENLPFEKVGRFDRLLVEKIDIRKLRGFSTAFIIIVLCCVTFLILLPLAIAKLTII